LVDKSEFISEQKYNDAIKEVFRLAGINRVVTVLDPTTRRDALKVFEAI
jgi:hypothetical protein